MNYHVPHSEFQPQNSGWGCTVIGVADTDVAQRMGMVVGSIIKIVLTNGYNLSRLEGTTISAHYATSLAELDRGSDLLGVLMPSEEFGVGMAMAAPVVRDDKVMARLMLHAGIALALISDDEEQKSFGLCTIVHELAHIHDLANKDIALPGTFLKPYPGDVLEAEIFNLSSLAWDEFLATSMSAYVQPPSLDAFDDILDGSIDELLARSAKARRSFFAHRDFGRLKREMFGPMQALLKFSAYVLGSLDGLGRGDGYGPKSRGRLLSSRFAPAFEALRLACARWRPPIPIGRACKYMRRYGPWLRRRLRSKDCFSQSHRTDNFGCGSQSRTISRSSSGSPQGLGCQCRRRPPRPPLLKMLDYFYRFRPAATLLDGYSELDRNEIYFPTVGELNDPLEGYKDIVWRGDRIVWRSLFRHYLLCLMQSVALVGIAGDDFSVEMAANLVYQTDADLPQAPIREIYSGICEAFFGYDSAEALLSFLSPPGKAVRRDELIFYLRVIHYSALTTVIRLFGERGLKLATSTASLADPAEKSMATLPELLRLHSFAEDQAETLFVVNNNITEQLALIHELNGDIPKDRRSWLLVARDFPAHYVEAIERLLYPDWHAACFVTDPTGASMWGHYGDGHRGMCLKFKAKPNSDGVASLDLYRRTSWSGDGRVGYSWVPHPFEAVDYASEFPEINFFESLGRLPLPKLSGFWYAGPNGERSEIASRILGGGAQWRDEYWQRFAAGCRIKSPQWAYEDEHRIVLHSNMDSLEAKENRKLKYRFEDLAGIIFGLKTSTEDKISAMRIIERKCVEAGRSDFEFWQAHYSRRTHRIELAPLSLVKISAGEDGAEPERPAGG